MCRTMTKYAVLWISVALIHKFSWTSRLRYKSEPVNVERFGFHISTHGCEIDVLISSRIRCTCKYPSVLVDLKINWNQDQRFLAPQPRICTFFLLRDYFSSPVDASDTTTVANLLLSIRLAGIKPFWSLSSLDILFLLPAWLTTMALP